MNMRSPKICSIVAIAENCAIGRDNGMIWHLPEDLRHFKRTTMGRPVIMGRKSYESLGKPLPGRPNVVVSRAFETLEIGAPSKIFTEMEGVQPGGTGSSALDEGPFLYPSVEAGIEAAQKMAVDLGVDEVFITGGGQIYAQTLPLTQRLYLTVLERSYEGDTFFPKIDWQDWTVVEKIDYPEDPAHDRPSFSIYTLERK
ncbi:MAG: dihydrofolate reductase [Alphaproteobacteria bacterium]|nr:dihydrofolate reductase [Alphaproteobacteria bacterium]